MYPEHVACKWATLHGMKLLLFSHQLHLTLVFLVYALFAVVAAYLFAELICSLCLWILQNTRKKGFSDCFGNEVLQVRAYGQAYISLGINIRCFTIFINPGILHLPFFINPILCYKSFSTTIVSLQCVMRAISQMLTIKWCVYSSTLPDGGLLF